MSSSSFIIIDHPTFVYWCLVVTLAYMCFLRKDHSTIRRAFYGSVFIGGGGRQKSALRLACL
jgi:hypothetical protein